MSKYTGHIVGGVAGAMAGVGASVVSYYKLRVPQIPLDWVALVFSGLVVGLLVYFVVWGHFQKDAAEE